MRDRSKPKRRLGKTALALLAVTATLSTGAQADQAATSEHNPPGDIPDNQVFVRYASPAGYELQVPEGWSRSITGETVSFADKYDDIEIAATPATAAPSVRSVQAGDVGALLKKGDAVEIKDVSLRHLKAGRVIRVVYQSKSKLNGVTGKQIRLDHERYSYFHGGKIVTLDLAAPAGADNADQWQRISNSFQWK